MVMNNIRMLKAPIWAVVVFFLLSMGLVACTKGKSTNETGSAAGNAVTSVTQIVVGTGNTYEPYCYLDGDGNLTGYELAVLQEVDRRLTQYTFRFEVYDFANILVSLSAGKVDIGAHQFEENANRRETYLFGEEGYNAYNGYLVIPQASPLSAISSVDDLAGLANPKLAVTAGSNYEAFVKTYNAAHDADHQLAWAIWGDYEVLFEGLASGTFSGSIFPLRDMALLNRSVPGINLVPIGDAPLIVSNTFFLFKKDNTVLQQAVDGALRQMKSDGTLERIRQEVVVAYYGDDI
jgi:L-cystine transport system substrate-binding protein